MLIHIVKTGDNVEKIIDSYRITKNELISNNLHITDFSHLKCGMKLKIPLLTKDNIETLEESEAFIDDYYPSFEKFIEANKDLDSIIVTKSEQTVKKEIDVVEETEVNRNIVINENEKEELQSSKLDEVNRRDQLSNQTKEIEQIESSVSSSEENKKMHPNFYNYPAYYHYPKMYNGAIIPKLDSKYIKKI